MSTARAIAPAPISPLALRLELHIARARLVQKTAGIPGGKVDWTHPRALVVQLLELQWSVLSDEERAAGDRALRQTHGACRLVDCHLGAT